MNKKLFTRSQRLLNQEQFKNVFDNKQKCRSSVMTVRYVKNTLDLGRLGVILSKKAIPTSVGRNKVRRQLRENFRLKQDEVAGWDVVFVAHPGIHQLTKPQLKQCIDSLWNKLQKSLAQSA